jgi:hypothetical protein
MRFLIVLILIIASVLGFRDFFSNSDNDFSALAFAFANISILYPLWISFLRHKNFRSINLSIYHIFSLLSYFIYIFPLTDLENLYFYNTTRQYNSITSALFFVALYYAFLWIFLFYLFKRNKITTDFTIIEFKSIAVPRAVLLLFTFLSIYFLIVLFRPDYFIFTKIGLGQTQEFLKFISGFWIAYLFIYRSTGYKIIALAWYVIYILFAFYSTQAGYLIIPGVSFFLLFYYKHRRVPLFYLVFVATIFIVLAGFKNQVRTTAWANKYSFGQTLNLWQDVLTQEGDENISTDLATGNVNRRIGHIALLSYVIDVTPSKKEPWGMYSYQLVFAKVIPRVIWPGKPKELIGNYFGKYYGILNPNDNTTSINLPIVVEAYISFLWFGIFFSFLPAIILFLAQYYMVKGRNLLWRFFGIFIFFSMINFESNFTLIAGNIFLIGVVLWFVDRYLLRNVFKYNLN